MNSLNMVITRFLTISALVAALILSITPANAITPTLVPGGGTCTESSQCAGPEPACIPVDTNNPTQGGKNCRNSYCSKSAARIVDASGKPTDNLVLKAGQFIEISSTSKYDSTYFLSAFYNNKNHYPSDPNQGNGTPRGIEVDKDHLDYMKSLGYDPGNFQKNANGYYNLVMIDANTAASKTHTMKIPAIYFYTIDRQPNANSKIATAIQVNSYFGANGQFSIPESNCVQYFELDPDSFKCYKDASCTAAPNKCSNGLCTTGPTVAPPTTAPISNASCPAGSACGTTNKCACNAGYNNCDNNWSNGCEVQGKCTQGQVCTDGGQCDSGVCKDHICQAKEPSGNGSCTDNSDCSNGYSCNSGKCMPNYCDATHSCPNGYSCKQGACFPGTCNATTAPCPNGYSCNADGACMPGKCSADTPCPPGYSCQDDGSCKKSTGAGTCTDDAACKTNGQCVNGACFCKAGAYNCDRDWANGCEATAPCAGSGVAKVKIKIKFNGIGANLPPVKETEKVKITLANKYLQAPIEKTVDFTVIAQADRGIRTFEGVAEFGNIPLGGDYSILIKGAHHIQKRICDNDPVETLDGRYNCTVGKITVKEGENVYDFSKIYQLAGDIPVSNEQSGFVDSVDITYLRSNLGSKDPEKQRVGDLNFDGIIDTQDYSLGLYTLSFKYDEVITGDE